MLDAQSLREHILQFLLGSLSLDDFEDWIVGASWNMHRHADVDLKRLVGAVELRLAEYSAAHLEVDELRHELQMLWLHGCPLPAVQMPVFSFTLPIAVSTISTTSAESNNGQRVVLAVGRGPNEALVPTRSAATRTVTAREAVGAS